MRPPFRQVSVPRSGKIFDHSVINQVTEKGLTRVYHNTPKTGTYYVNEKTGLYIFSTFDTADPLKINYIDVEVKKSEKIKQFMLKPLQLLKEAL